MQNIKCVYSTVSEKVAGKMILGKSPWKKVFEKAFSVKRTAANSIEGS